ncbi:MAG TPA: transposase [Ramlibacter sp.]
MATRDRSKEAFWRRMMRRQAGSGMSVRAWCGRHDLSEASFYWWRRRLAPSGRPADKPGRHKAGTPQFVPVRIAADQADATSDGRPDCIEIILPGNQRVRVLGAVNRRALADVLAVLRSGDIAAVRGTNHAVGAEAAAC